MVSPSFYKLLILIETLQQIYFSIHPRLSFLMTTSLMDVIRAGVRYFQVNYFLSDQEPGPLIILIYVVASINIIIGLLVACLTYRKGFGNKQATSFETYSLRLLGLYSILFVTVFTLPMVEVILSGLYCNEKSKIFLLMNCYRGFHLIHLFFSAISGAIFLLTLIITHVFLIENNPFSTIPFSAPVNILNLVKFFMTKFFCPLFFLIDPNKILIKQFIVIYGLTQILVLGLRIFYAPMYNRGVYKFVIFCETVALWFTLTGNIHAFLDRDSVDNIGIVYLIIGIPFTGWLTLEIVNKKFWDSLKSNISDLKKEDEKKQKDDIRVMMKLEGILRFHVKHCEKYRANNCVCLRLYLQNEKLSEDEINLLWFKFLNSIISDALEKFPKNSKLLLFNSYLQQEKLKNKFKALFELMSVEDNKPSIQQEFSLFRYRQLIEEEMIDKENLLNDIRGLDVNKMVLFQKHLVEFQSAVEDGVNMYIEFWRELFEENPDIQKLQNLGGKINFILENIKGIYKKLHELNPNNVLLLETYGVFLKDIVNQTLEGKKFLERAQAVNQNNKVNQNFVDINLRKYGQNSTACIISVSGNNKTIGIVNNFNEEMKRILGYSKNDVIGQNISRIMPKVYADLHDGFMKRFLETSGEHVVGKERLVFPQNKAGYMIPCSLMIKVLPDLEEGIQIIGFIQESEEYEVEEFKPERSLTNANDAKVFYLLYNGFTGIIQGVTPNCYSSFGIASSFIYGNSSMSNEFTITSIIKKIDEEEVYEGMKKSSGIILTIDTTSLPNMGQNDADAENEDRDEDGEYTRITERNQRFRQANIRISLVYEENFGDTRINCIKFIEMKGTGPEKAQSEEKKIAKKILNDDFKRNQIDFNRSENDLAESLEGESVNKDESSNLNNLHSQEDAKNLKDFNYFIKEKATPKTVLILKRTVLFIFLALTGLKIFDFVYKTKQQQDFQTAIASLKNEYKRSSIMADINLNSRKLQLLAIGMIDNSTISTQEQEKALKTMLKNQIDELQSILYTSITYQIAIEDKISHQTSKYFQLATILQNGNIKLIDYLFNDAIVYYQGGASTISQSSLESFRTAQNVESTGKSFFLVVENGLGILRKQSELLTEAFYNAYYDFIDKYMMDFTIVFILACVLISGALLIILPIVFKVIEANKRVLSLFGAVPQADIKELTTRCEKFLEIYVKNKEDKNDSEISSEGSQTSPEANANVENKKEKPEVIELNNEDGGGEFGHSSFIDKSKIEEKIPLKSGGEENNQKNASKPNNEGKKTLSKEEWVKVRSERLLNSKEKTRKTVSFQFVLFGLFFLGVFIVDFIIEINFNSSAKQSYIHLRYLGQQPSIVKYVVVYTFEELAEGKPRFYDGIYQRERFTSLIYTFQETIDFNLKQSFPSSFDSYYSQYILYNYGKLCDNAFKDTNKTQCQAVAQGLLNQGMQSGLFTLAETTRDIISKFNKTAKSTKDSLASINGELTIKTNNILNFVIPAIDDLNLLFLSCFNDFLNINLSYEKLKFSLGLTAFCLIFLFGWIPYLRNLNSNIWRIKGMLNMIPMDMIFHNKYLKGLLSGNLLNIVK